MPTSTLMKARISSSTCFTRQIRNKVDVLSKEFLEKELAVINDGLPQPFWSVSSSPSCTQLEASYKFKNYIKTWGFLNSVAAAAYKLRHHPTIVTTYNKVHFAITTHDAGNNITYLDTKLATAIHNIYTAEFVEHTSRKPLNPSSAFAMDKAIKIIDELTKKD